MNTPASSMAGAPPAPLAPPLGPAPTAQALRLGYAGLAPFVAGALLVWFVNADAHPYVALALSSYAAVIVSFLGGIHWGLGFRHGQARLFAWGVVPSLAAWLGVMMPPHAGLVIHGVMLIVCYAVDRRWYAELGLQAWLTLRFRLSAVASLSCFVGAAGS